MWRVYHNAAVQHTSAASSSCVATTIAACNHRRHQTTTTSTSSSSLAYPLILQHFLHAYNDGNTAVMEPFLHHTFVFEQAPILTLQPKLNSMYKFDFLKRVPDVRSAFASRTVEVQRLIEQGNTCVVEAKSISVLGMDVNAQMKKGQTLETYATTWFDFDPATKTIVKMKSYECLSMK